MSECSRRRFLTSIAAAASAAVVGRTGSARSPLVGGCEAIAGKTIRWIVPYSPGGGYDLHSRLVEPFYEQQLGAEIRVDNLPGAGGLIAARRIHAARPDGLTVGILNGTGTVVASILDQKRAPNPATDFSILGSTSFSPYVWAVGAESGIRTVDDLFQAAPTRPIVVGMTELGSSGFVVTAVMSELLQVRCEYLTGFAGSREASLAAVTGSADLVCYQVESILDLIDSGDLRPLLLFGSGPIPSRPALSRLPVIQGDRSFTHTGPRSSRYLDRHDPIATALDRVIRVGRLVVAPPGLAPRLESCLTHALDRALADPELQASASRASLSVDRLDSKRARAIVSAAVDAAPVLAPIVQAAVNRLRG